jgi:hypothetical protein
MISSILPLSTMLTELVIVGASIFSVPLGSSSLAWLAPLSASPPLGFSLRTPRRQWSPRGICHVEHPLPQPISRLCYRLASDLVCRDWLFSFVMRERLHRIAIIGMLGTAILGASLAIRDVIHHSSAPSAQLLGRALNTKLAVERLVNLSFHCREAPLSEPNRARRHIIGASLTALLV